MSELYVNRYLCPNIQKQNLDSFSFLTGELTYISSQVTYTMDIYKKFEDIRHNPYNFIIGNGGLGKSTYLKQIKAILDKNKIPCILIELRTLSDEIPIYSKINDFYRYHNNSKEIYLLLDAVDEAIDCNVKNIANKITEALSQIINSNKNIKVLKISDKNKFNKIKRKLKNSHQKILNKKLCNKFYNNPNVKTIITCRDNRIPKELVPNLQTIYNTKNDNTFHLCRLTEEDVKKLASSLNCHDIEDFIKKIKEYNLGSFASSPITLKPLITMYESNELDSKSNNYDIYENLMRNWCEESEYRKNKALNNEDKFQLKPIDEILFVASKIAIELKLSGKNEISYTKNDTTIFAEEFYNLSYELPNGKKVVFTKELVDYTLKTKIFCKVNDQFFIEQQTYKDFLVARYLLEMHAKENELYKLLKHGNDFHPNFSESLAYLAVKNNKIFTTVLKEIPERVLLSSIYFCSDSQKEALFNAYLKCVKADTISFWGYSPGRMFFNKKLFYPKLNRILKNKIKMKDKDIKEAVIDIIWDNRLSDFESEFRNIIFDTSENTRIKVLAIYASKDCLYNKILKEIAENLNNFNDEINKDTTDQLRGIILNCLYPEFIDTETMLSYLKEPMQSNFFGYYKDFLKYKFPNSINRDNARLFMDWILQNRNMEEVVRCSYNAHYTDNIKKIFNQISKILNYELIDKFINLQLAEQYAWQVVSDDIINAILHNDDFRQYFVKQFIQRSSNISNFRMFIQHIPNMITTYEIPIYLKMYADEKDTFRKDIIEILIQNIFRTYIENDLTDDIDNIYSILQTNEELKDKFGYFINAIVIDSMTIEPVAEYAISAKKHYYANLKNKEKSKQHQQKINELNNFPKQLDKILYKYEQNKNLQNTVLELFRLLNLEKESLYYQQNISIVLNEHIRWKNVPENKKQELIDIFKEFLLNSAESELTNIDKYISENTFNMNWNCLAILPLLKNSNFKNYNKILQDWSDVIIYLSSNSEEALSLKQELIKDLYSINPNLVYDGILKVITKAPNMLQYNFLKSLETIWDKNLSINIFELIKTKQLNNGIQFELIQALAYKQYEPIGIYIQNSIKELMQAKEIDDNKIGNLLNILFYGFEGKFWKYIKKIIYKNKISKEAFLILMRKTASQNIYANDSMYKLLSCNDLVELYKWIIKKYPYINQLEFKTGIVHDTDWLKDFTERIPDYFITTGNVKGYKKIKNVYLKNRKNKENYQKFFNRSLKLTKYNHLQSIKINHKTLAKLENLYFKEKKGLVNMKIAKNIFGDNNINIINENCKNKTSNFGTGITVTLIIIIIAVGLFISGKIDISQLMQIIIR
ncbi:MAG: hypothetical protein NC390_06705 [Fusobacterium sp.]|nr:hypothetical protein [Fusobacterium sp.]